MSIEYFKVNGVTVANIKNSSDISLFGFAMLAGAAYETKDIAGIAHFAEHLFFKGTKTRNVQQINKEFARLGVERNAYTGNNEVFYHTTCIKDNIPSVIELMMDMLFNATMPEEELEIERKVIIEEKKAAEDDPKLCFCNDTLNKICSWNIGHEILGSFKTINSIQKSDIVKYLDDKINLENLIFVHSGNIDSEDLKKYISSYMPSEHSFLKQGSKNILKGNEFWSDLVKSTDKIKYTVERENITQASLDMYIRGLSRKDVLFHDMMILCRALGGGMYSLLWNKIRDELGLCYNIGMIDYVLDFPDKVMLNLYGYSSPENVPLFIEASEEVLNGVKKNGIDKDLFECAKIDYTSLIYRKTETSSSKAMFMVKNCLVDKKGDVEGSLNLIDKVTLDRVNGLASKLLDAPYNWAVMVPSSKK